MWHVAVLIINPIPIKWMPFRPFLPLSIYLRHGFCSESELPNGNRVNHERQILYSYIIHVQIEGKITIFKAGILTIEFPLPYICMPAFRTVVLSHAAWAA